MNYRPRGDAAYRREPDGADRSWHNRAACSDVNPELFFESSPEFVDAAKRICQPCPVRTECLEFAITTHQDDGVWGGLTEDERAGIRRRRSRTARDLHDDDVEALRLLVSDGVLTVTEAARKYGIAERAAEELTTGIRRPDSPGPILTREPEYA